MLLYPNQKLHIVLSGRDKFIQEQLAADALMGNPIAQRCQFHFYDDMNTQTFGGVLQQMPLSINEPVLAIINESRQTAITEQVAANLLANYSTFVKLLVIYPRPDTRQFTHARTATIVPNEIDAVRWI
jgi:hypothetical protein